MGQKDLGTVIFTLNAEDFFKQKNRWPPATWTHILTVSQGKKLPKSLVRKKKKRFSDLIDSEEKGIKGKPWLLTGIHSKD